MFTSYGPERGVAAQRGEVAAGVAVGERGEARQLGVAQLGGGRAARQHAPQQRAARGRVRQRHVHALREPPARHIDNILTTILCTVYIF